MNYMAMVVVLLHLCQADAMAVGAMEANHQATEFDQAAIIGEIIRDLKKILNVDLVPVKHFKVPKIKETHHCFAKDLEHVIIELNKTSLKDSLKHDLQTLRMNAKHLREHYLVDKEVCKSDQNQFRPMKRAIRDYIHFLQKMFQSIVPGR